MKYLTGTEISVTFAGETVHIVGLGFDAGDPAMHQGLQATRGGREARARDMAEQLTKVGIHGAYEGALKYVGNPDLISRTHFARFLVEVGACRDTSEVFRKYLTEGKPGYVPHRWASLRDAVQWITSAGGMAVIAHPARYKLTANEEYALFSEFKAHGGRGVEVVTGSHTAAEYVKYGETAREFELAASRGSDFHSTLVIIRPGGEGFTWASLLPLGLVASNTCFQVLTSKLARTEDPLTMHLYTGWVGTLVASLAVPFVWTQLGNPWLWVGLCVMGLMATVGHFMLILAYQRAPAATLTPYLYAQIGFALLAGWVVFSHVPDGWSIAGMALIAACGAGGAWLTVREHRALPQPAKA
jgi:predicted metal-dependent phosphoesterase TrpH